MISTVTTSTVSTVSTLAMAGSLGLIAVMLLLSLLIQKEIIGPLSGRRAEQLRRTLNIGIVPLAIVFVLIAVTKIVGVLR
jgi:hypothetical protein